LNRKVKELLEVVKKWHENGVLVLHVSDITTLLIEEYGFDVPRNVNPKVKYLKDRKILQLDNAKAATYKINLRLLGDLLDDPKLKEDAIKQDEEEVKRLAGGKNEKA